MNDLPISTTRIGRAVGATCLLIAGTIPLGVVLVAAIAAGLSDNPDATGPGTSAFLFTLAVMVGCTALAARVALEPALRANLGRWWFAAAVLALAPSTRLSLPPRWSSCSGTEVG